MRTLDHKVTVLDPAILALEDQEYIAKEIDSAIDDLGDVEHDTAFVQTGRLETLNEEKVKKPRALTAEALCMLQALNSRSSEGIEEKLAKVYAGNPKEFADKYIIGYNHKSVGQGASTTIFIENVSILAAKAVQNSRYYKGIEASTRYIDLSRLGYTLPKEMGDEYNQIVDRWLIMFEEVRELMYEHYKSYEKPEDTSDTKWDNACKAAAFDVARGWIPLAQNTILSWHGDLCSVGEHTQYLRTSPISEMVDLGETIYSEVTKLYPTSIPPLSDQRKEYLRLHNTNNSNSGKVSYMGPPGSYIDDCECYYSKYNEIKTLLESRPYQTYPHISLNYEAFFEVKYDIDYGSWRDMQRHRPIMTDAPIVNPESDLHPWYMEQLPSGEKADKIKDKTKKLKQHVVDIFKSGDVNMYNIQYLCPMATTVSYRNEGGLADLVYMVELRSGAAVHPTCRQVALAIGDSIEQRLGVKLFLDKSEHVVYAARGGDTITEVK